MIKKNFIHHLNTTSPKEKKLDFFPTLKNYSTFQNLSKFDEIKLITIGLASPDKVRYWAETKLPDGTILGQVYNANTLHHKTLKPLKGGLFCERIFGPIKDFQCSCGIQKEKPMTRIVNNYNRKFCNKCNVEYTWSLKRRYQLGYIRLVSPVTHLWYLKSNPSFISVMLDMKKKDVESITYCTDILTIDSSWKPGRNELGQWPFLLKIKSKNNVFEPIKIESQKKLEYIKTNFYIKSFSLINNHSNVLIQSKFSLTKIKWINLYVNHFKNYHNNYDFWWRFINNKTSSFSPILFTKWSNYFPLFELYLIKTQFLLNSKNGNNKKNRNIYKKNWSKKPILYYSIYNLKKLFKVNSKVLKNLIYIYSLKSNKFLTVNIKTSCQETQLLSSFTNNYIKNTENNILSSEFKLLKNKNYLIKLNFITKKYILFSSWKIFWNLAYHLAKTESGKNIKNLNNIIYKFQIQKLFFTKRFIRSNKKKSYRIQFMDLISRYNKNYYNLKKTKLEKTHYLNKKMELLGNNLNINSFKLNYCLNRISFKLFLVVNQYFFKKILNFFTEICLKELNLDFSKKEFTTTSFNLKQFEIHKNYFNLKTLKINQLIKQKKFLLLILIKKIKSEITCWKLTQNILKIENLITKNYLNFSLNNKTRFLDSIKYLSENLLNSIKIQKLVPLTLLPKSNLITFSNNKLLNSVNKNALNNVINQNYLNLNHKNQSIYFFKKQLPGDSDNSRKISIQNSKLLNSNKFKKAFISSKENSINIFSKVYKQLNYWYTEQFFISKYSNFLKLKLGLKIEKTILIINFFFQFSHKIFLNSEFYLAKIKKNPIFLNKNFLKNFLYQREILFGKIIKLIKKYYFLKKLCSLTKNIENLTNNNSNSNQKNLLTSITWINKLKAILSFPLNLTNKKLRFSQMELKQSFTPDNLILKLSKIKSVWGLNQKDTISKLNKKQISSLSTLIEIVLKNNRINTFSIINQNKNLKTFQINKKKYYGTKKFLTNLKKQNFYMINQNIQLKLKTEKNYKKTRKKLISQISLLIQNLPHKKQNSSFLALYPLLHKFVQSIIVFKNSFEKTKSSFNKFNTNNNLNNNLNAFIEIFIIELNQKILRILLLTNLFCKNSVKKNIKKHKNVRNVRIEKKIDFINFNYNNNSDSLKDSLVKTTFNLGTVSFITFKNTNTKNDISDFSSSTNNNFHKYIINSKLIFYFFTLQRSGFFIKNLLKNFSIVNWKQWIKFLKIYFLKNVLKNKVFQANNFNNFFIKKLVFLNTQFKYITKIKSLNSNAYSNFPLNPRHKSTNIFVFCKLQKELQMNIWKRINLKKFFCYNFDPFYSLNKINTNSLLDQNYLTQKSSRIFINQLTFSYPQFSHFSIPLKTRLYKSIISSRTYLLNSNFCSQSEKFYFNNYKYSLDESEFFYKKIQFENYNFKKSFQLNCVNQLHFIQFTKTVNRINGSLAYIKFIWENFNFLFINPFKNNAELPYSKKIFYQIKTISEKLNNNSFTETGSSSFIKIDLNQIFLLKTIDKNKLTKNIENKTKIAFTRSEEFKLNNFLFNNIYCLSHRYSWNNDMELQNFLNYINVPDNPYDISIRIYKHRLMKSLIFREPPAIIGGGLIQKLLTEFNPNESKKIIQQLNKQIRKVNILLIKSMNHSESRNLRQKRTFLLRRVKYIRNVSYKFTEDFFKSLQNADDLKKIPFTDSKNSDLIQKNFNSIILSSQSNNKFLENNKERSNINVSDLLKKSVEQKDLFQNTNFTPYLKINNLKTILKESRPEWMVLSFLPVLPPDLRPIIQIQNQVAASDLNRLYQKVIYRNERLKRFLKDSASSNSPQMKFAYRLLQEAVDNLIDNGKGKGNIETDNRGRPLKSLTELLKGKKGRFRQNLLGKRVDYSGRSVIVVGPKLRLHECGLPKEMALELFMPFLIQKIFKSGKASTILGAKKIIQNEPHQTWNFLTKVMRENPVLLNRAPTLHRLGFQAFQPKLIRGRAILLHPLVCPAFNADFDGDQMAVHVPITVESKIEAWKIMLARNHLLSAATGEAMLVPSQDMVLGSYYLTVQNNKLYNELGRGQHLFKIYTYFFNTIDEVVQAYQCQKIQLHSNIWLKWNHIFETENKGEKILELHLNKNGQYKQIFHQFSRQLNNTGNTKIQYIKTTTGRVLFYSLFNQ
uniref:DNA-directed RNA polymerase subunit beta' n=1 Tax=Aphanochaete elegans TaxID=764105 RepID=A0A6H1XDL5_9CHLO|nr:beta' subunit of RNA polymerase [Aphanochaete elegans]QJA13713.1 beta' subunit of RNA polymerase [Aphanochaete elegans]